ncbi:MULTISPECIES: MBL fold metallo-hydrolase [Mucilaginibacter]|uniref:MBL fold metallo-hydrolase n=1 Tax=Mucilaginibacter TaxID=423349 RepID=UPI0033909BC7
MVVWFGHSSVLIKHTRINISIDPIFSSLAGPLPGVVSAFDGASHYTVQDMPAIDIPIISHDHYDHLDYPTIKSLRKGI